MLFFVFDRPSNQYQPQQHLSNRCSGRSWWYASRETPSSPLASSGASPGRTEEAEQKSHGHPSPDGQTLSGEQHLTGMAHDWDSHWPSSVRLVHYFHLCQLHHHHRYLDLEQLICCMINHRLKILTGIVQTSDFICVYNTVYTVIDRENLQEFYIHISGDWYLETYTCQFFF